VTPPPFTDLQALLDALPIGVSVYGPDDRLLSVNLAYRAVMGGAYIGLGETRTDIVRRRVAEGEYGSDEAAAEFVHATGARPASPQTHRRRRPDGRTIEVCTAPLPGGGRLSTMADVTALADAETELSGRLADMDEMLAHIQHGIVLFDKDHRLVTHNALVERMLGLPPGLLRRGRSSEEAMLALLALGEYGTGPEAGAFIRSWRARDLSRPHIHQRATRAGRVLEVRSSPTRSGGYINTYTDITDLRATEAELRRAKEQAEAGSEAKSRFLATIGHELLTPLNAVIGFSELLAGETGSSPRAAEFAAAILAAGKRLSVLINAVLDVARIERSTLDLSAAPIDPRHLVEAALHHAAASAFATGVVLASALPCDLPAVRGDARRLGQALDHLLSNAIKFTEAGGHVRVEAEIREGERLVLRVRDTGIGIGETDLEKLFRPFRQVEDGFARRFEGAGLGLFVSRAVAEAHGGSLTLESAAGQGTTAILELPIASFPQAPHFTTGRSGGPP